MPTVDMPIEELLTYQGKNPRPQDFDTYWEDALAELKQTDPKVTLEPSTFQTSSAECHDLYFTGVGGARIYAKYIKPLQVTEPHPAVLHFHGYSGHSPDWSELLKYVAAGFSVLAMDVRGQGGRSEDNSQVVGNTLYGHIIRGVQDPKTLFFRNVFLDTAQLVRVAGELNEVDPNRIVATGSSQGGALTLACGALAPSVKKLAANYPFLSDYQRVWEMDAVNQAYREIVDYFRRFDPTHSTEKEFFTNLGYIDIQHLANRISGEVLMGVGLMDLSCPPSSQFAAYNKIESEKSYALYPDFAHENLPGQQDRMYQFLLNI
ncbi:alpha/beta fold hydrolase [Alkalicoccobacillus murimartini]|uniref:Cephalosporin-C deacetylase n=1 Tax=Alkalicoccobacillus murimartini TaxID=171685 RepID=A0ABT9YJF6_9BACI|nr:alpha/beta fold hydrolase [Alkalicoccobacillus murimartini]MDQ0207866.1 cephalosporin-C deacetylase [Alkalicoccobacillus murimartini]